MDKKCAEQYVWNYQACRIFREQTGLDISMSQLRIWGLEGRFGIDMVKIGGRWAIRRDTIPTLETVKTQVW